MLLSNESNKAIEQALVSIPNVRRDELFVFFGQIGYYDLAQIKELFININALEKEDERMQAFVMAGVGKLYLLEGNYLYAKKLLSQARFLAQKQNRLSKNPSKDEVYAYVLYETGLLFRHLFEPDLSIQNFQFSIDLTDSKILRLFASYQLDTCFAEEVKDIKSLMPYLDLMKPYPIQLILVLNRIGIIFSEMDQPKLGFKYVDEGLEIAKEHGFTDLESVLTNSIGYNYFLQKKYDLALETLENNFKSSTSYYTKSLSCENIGLVFFQLSDYQKTIKYVTKANKIAKQHSVISQIPGQHIYLGQVYEEKLLQLADAREQYHLGYEAATEQVTWGLSFTGERRKAVDIYVGFLQRHSTESLSPLPPKHPFEFTIGKSWKEIKDLFYQQLFQFHLAQNNTAEEMCKKLKIKPTTYYSLRARLAKEGNPLPLQRSRKAAITDPSLLGLRDWIKERQSLTRQEIETAFDREALAFLYKRHGHRKNVLSRVLNLSYPTIVNKTKFLYQKGFENF